VQVPTITVPKRREPQDGSEVPGDVPRRPASGATQPVATRAAWSNLRNGTYSLVDQAVASGANFAAGVIIGRVCSKDDFGLYMLGLSVALLLTSVQDIFIATPYVVFSPRLRGVQHAQ
jgi:hypothetical protein